ncbi:MAG: PIN domain-containing protein [Lachnospiraceae bacterium]|nr:PIN domain-containing protein [Lachnospiraceae bacterium]
MNYYLVDYENVKSHGLDGITSLDENDVLIIFYSENADSLTFGLHRRLNESLAKISYQKVDVGTKNALDFQLATYLGYLIRDNEGKESSYYIVTKDQGYSSLVNYWKKRKINVSLIVDLSGRDEEKEKNDLRVQVEKVVSDEAVVEIVVKYIQQYKTKLGINNALAKEFKDSKKASEIYNAIKPLIADKKGQ